MSYTNIIGRTDEIATLKRLYNSGKSEFVAIYGRRRVGKSFLVSEVFAKKMHFKVVGTYIKMATKTMKRIAKFNWLIFMIPSFFLG